MYAIWMIEDQRFFNGHYSTGVVDARDIEPEYLFSEIEEADEFIECSIQDEFDVEVQDVDRDELFI